MRVAVLGSWRYEDKGLSETPDAFRTACRRVGSELIKRGHSLIVGSDSEHTADSNAALGAIEALKLAGTPVESPRIMLIRPDSSSDRERPFLALRQANPGVFVEHQVDSASWAVAKLVQAGPRKRSKPG